MNEKTFTSIKIYLSAEEKSRVESISRAHGISLSEFCKNRILKSGINIIIKTEDLSQFAHNLSEISDSVKSILSISRNSSSVSYDKIDSIDEILNDLNNNCRMLLKDRYKKRLDSTKNLQAYITNYLDSK